MNPNQSITARFRTYAISGALANADSLPTGTLYVDGTASAAVVTVANVSTGLYTATATVPADVTAAQRIALEVTATVAGVTSAETVLSGAVLDKTGYALAVTPPTAGDIADAVGLPAGLGNAVTLMLSKLTGRITKEGDVLTYYALDGTTPLFVLTMTENERTTTVGED